MILLISACAVTAMLLLISFAHNGSFPAIINKKCLSILNSLPSKYPPPLTFYVTKCISFFAQKSLCIFDCCITLHSQNNPTHLEIKYQKTPHCPFQVIVPY
jgi:hypothetical protein